MPKLPTCRVSKITPGDGVVIETSDGQEFSLDFVYKDFSVDYETQWHPVLSLRVALDFAEMYVPEDVVAAKKKLE